MKTLKSNKIHFPYTPSEWVGVPTYKDITEIRISYGGGMSSSYKTLYVERENNIIPNTIQEFTLISGEKIKINTSFVVTVENKRMVEAKFISQNPHFPKENTVRYKTKDDIDVILSTEYKDEEQFAY